MNAARLLSDLRGSGAEVRLAGERLVVRVPRGSASADLKRTIATHKHDLMALLRGSGSLESAQIADVEPAAYRLRTRRFGDVWLVADDDAQDFLRSAGCGGLPVGDVPDSVDLLTV